MKISVLGCGRWGKNIIRTLSSLTKNEDFSFEEVVHTGNPSRAERIQDNFDLECHTNLEAALERSSAVCIATPDETHPRLVEKALNYGVDVFVEKPLAFDLSTAENLLKRAEERNRLLMPGHLMVYHPLLDSLKDQGINGNQIDEIMVTRFNNLRKSGERRLLQSSLIHDLSVFDVLFETIPRQINIHESIGEIPPGRYLTAKLSYSNTPVHLRARMDWPLKERTMMFRSNDKYLRFDGLEEKLEIVHPDRKNTANQTIQFDRLPLTEELKNFVRAIKGEEKCRIGTNHVLRVMETIQRIEEQAKQVAERKDK